MTCDHRNVVKISVLHDGPLLRIKYLCRDCRETYSRDYVEGVVEKTCQTCEHNGKSRADFPHCQWCRRRSDQGADHWSPPADMVPPDGELSVSSTGEWREFDSRSEACPDAMLWLWAKGWCAAKLSQCDDDGVWGWADGSGSLGGEWPTHCADPTPPAPPSEWVTPPGLDEMAARADERQATEAWVCSRLTSWLAETPRRDAGMAFTAGPLRDLARVIEGKVERS